MVMLLMTGLLQQVYAQNRSLSGRVTDRSSGQGLPGATVLVKGTTVGASTNADGSFTLSVPATATTLTFSSIGYTTVEQPIGADNTYNVALATDAKELGEVVVTGALGIQRQSQSVGYATATLDTKEINQARVTNVTNGLAGKVSGLQIQTIGAGINPQVRVTLRGSRSLLGNNEALIVVDGVISPNEVLTALNPDDIASISVLKGANAAALYGSQASNGAMIVTTKRGGGEPKVTLSQTSQFESVSFLPKLQSEFGPGANSWTNSLDKFTPDNSVDSNENTAYNSFENQQFGPRFDGSMRPFGEELANGHIQMLSYEARPNEKRNFFNNGYQMQNGITFSAGGEKSKFYASYQNVHNNGIVPKDKFDRNTFRFNASQEINRLTVGLNISYSQQAIDATSNASRDQSVYWNWFNTSVMAPLTSYKNWQSDEFANPNGYYNAFYFNPYWVLDNNRTKSKQNTILGNLDLSYKIFDWLRIQGRLGTTNINQNSLATQNKFVYNAYVRAGNTNKNGTGTPGFVEDLSSSSTLLNSDVFLSMDKTFGDISVQAILGNNFQQFDSRYNFVNSTALSVPDLFNLGNRVGNLGGADKSARSRVIAYYADVTLGYKDFFYLHGSGRYDGVSILDPGNRNFFYPGVDASLIFTNAIPTLKDLSFLDYGKIRGGITKVSQVNLLGQQGPGVYAERGAYQLQPVFGLGAGYPFGPASSFTAGNRLIQSGLLPEETRSIETGLELSFLKRRIAGAVTYYNQRSVNQTLPTSISGTTGYTSLLLNAGTVENNGIEADLNITPIRQEGGLTVTVGGNFNYNENKVISLSNGLTQLALSTGGNAQLYAIPGQPFPVLQGSHYQRTADGLVKMGQTKDPYTNEVRYFPLKAADNQSFGNTQPKYKYGMNASVSYKGLTLAGQGELRTGYVVYNSIGEDLDFTGSGARSVQYGRKDFVYPNSAILGPDGVTYVPNTSGLTGGGAEFWAQNSTWNRTVAENYVTSGKFFKIREVSLSYALPTSMLTKVAFVKGVSVNVYGRNIFTWVPKENIYTDPEFSFSNSNAIGINTNLQTPPTKFYGATLSATF
ncbi:SusC/RagA family TonB-linked outer membrane protein [Hymenobacter sp. BT770]|uniref:SusC/RagA family TonB-linked outer membrane protein n=1 Tax=Hymenobacter sp. BT770 TaxID=2886942 RepID=UPI001D10C120|nr:SusC/RagA family TonB-linked outer membrane protein [Hymenobacter sp. BT770]MCC3152622.1 SusC/RagA family TonB-linked outer membrane protein [Hymenobacter sp. BT770]MDO3414695.1 SusC/RagA family TonB-linked outer membrane protein [Hymenobacter sp. BT770]